MALTDNLISWWDLEESSGTRVDAHGSNDLTDINTVGSATGKVGDAADFERDNSEYLSISDASQSGLDITGDFTIAAWVKPESIPGDLWIVCKGDVNSGTRDVAYWFGVASNGALQARASDDGTLNSGHNTAGFSTAGDVSAGTFYHVVVTFDVSTDTFAFYVDNVDTTSTSSTGSMGASINNSTDRFSIGERENNGSPSSSFDGLIDSVGIWSRIITSSERDAVWNSGDGVNYAALTGGGGAVDNALFFGGGM